MLWHGSPLECSPLTGILLWGTSFQERICSCAPNSVPFHASSASSFFSKCIFRSPCNSSHLSFFMASGLCLPPLAATEFSETYLSSSVCSSDWRELWHPMSCFHLFQAGTSCDWLKAVHSLFPDMGHPAIYTPCIPLFTPL